MKARLQTRRRYYIMWIQRIESQLNKKGGNYREKQRETFGTYRITGDSKSELSFPELRTAGDLSQTSDVTVLNLWRPYVFTNLCL